MSEPITPEELHAAHRWIRLDELVHLPGNPNQGHEASLSSSVDEFGWIDGIVVHQGVIIAGNHRVDQARARQLEGLPGYDLSAFPIDDARRMAMALAHNATTRAGVDDPTLLADALSAVGTTDRGLAEVAGLDLAPAGVLELLDLDTLERRPPIPTEAADAPPPDPPPEAVTQLGDVWTLGRHLLICGDATNPDVARAACHERLAEAMLTDPPYGVDYGDTVDWRTRMGFNQRDADDAHVVNDHLDQATALWAATWPVWRNRLDPDGSAFYVWAPPGPQVIDLGHSLIAAGLEPRGSIVIWRKDTFVFGHSDHKYQHEACWYGWRSDGRHRWHGPNNESSVWDYLRPRASELHPTQKPVELFERCLRNITTVGDLVVDPFAGSGTTLIAAERMNRTAGLVELKPIYCDVIARRWATLTGGTPLRNGQAEALR